MTDDMQKQQNEILKTFIRSPDKSKQKLLDHILNDAKHERIRDFIVAEGIGQINSPSIIVHVPSGMWRGFSLSYNDARHRLLASPEEDKELVKLIFEV